MNTEETKENDFWVECNVCKGHLKNWTGSTPCCGSIAYLIEDGEVTKKLSLYISNMEGVIKPMVFDTNKGSTHFD